MNALLFDLATGLLSLVILYLGAEILVRGSTDLGLRLGLSPLLVGLTIVAMATSSPEMVVSIQAAMKGQPDIALGNVFGSNLCNIGLVLGLAALIAPMAVDRVSIRLDGPVMLATAILGGWIVWDRSVSRWEGILLVLLLAVYLVYRIWVARRDRSVVGEELPAVPRWPLAVALAAVVMGLLLLAVGGDWLVRSGVSLATRFNVPEAFIAITLVAIGTSLPELATSLVAAWKREADIAVGNILGSNIFNVLAVLGTSALVAPLGGSGDFRFEILAAAGLSILLLPLLRSGARIERWEGALLLVGYIAILTVSGGSF